MTRDAKTPLPEPMPLVTPTTGWKKGPPPKVTDIAWICVEVPAGRESARFVALARRMTGIHEDETWSLMACCPHPSHATPPAETHHELHILAWSELPVPQMPIGIHPVILRGDDAPKPARKGRGMLGRIFRRS